MTCLFLGTPAFAIPSIERLRASSACTLLGAITKPDEPAGRGNAHTAPPIAACAHAHGIPLWQPTTTEAFTARIAELHPDVAVVVAYGRIIPQEALAIPRFGFVNLHPSLLPKYRGPSPVHAAIANGDAETGISLMLLDAAIDHGPLLAQERVAIPPGCTRSTLDRLLAERGADLLARTLPQYLAGRMIPQPQDDAAATMTPLLTREHGRIDWRVPASVILRMVRAYEDWPGTWCVLPNGKRLKVLAASEGIATVAPPGTITSNTLHVACGGGMSIALDRVQPEGGPEMDGIVFLHGFRGKRILPVA